MFKKFTFDKIQPLVEIILESFFHRLMLSPTLMSVYYVFFQVISRENS